VAATYELRVKALRILHELNSLYMSIRATVVSAGMSRLPFGDFAFLMPATPE
jgi:hypothetical protein